MTDKETIEKSETALFELRVEYLVKECVEIIRRTKYALFF